MKAHPHVVSAKHGTETVLLNAQSGRYYTLNDAGGFIWSMLCSDATSSQITDALVVHYDVDIARATNDLHTLTDALLAAGLVTE